MASGDGDPHLAVEGQRFVITIDRAIALLRISSDAL